MKHKQLWAAVALTSATIAMSAPAWAAKDVLYPATSSEGTGNVLKKGNPGHVNLGAKAPGALVTVDVTWSIENNKSKNGANTAYGTTVEFRSVADPGVGPVSVAAPSCAVSGIGSTCATTIGFNAPTTPGSYTVHIKGADIVRGEGSDTEILVKQLVINFSVASLAKIPTTTDAEGTYCAFLNGTVDLRGTLTTAVAPITGIAGESIEFAIETLPGNGNMQGVGSAMTGASGQALLPNVSLLGRGVGDYEVRAHFAGDMSYDGSQDTSTLGIQYRFGGFQSPIKPDLTYTVNGNSLPIKIKISDALNQPVPNAAPTVWLNAIGDTALESGSASTTGNQMRYAKDEDSYIFNWDVSAIPAGTYSIVVDLGSKVCPSQNQMATVYVTKTPNSNKK